MRAVSRAALAIGLVAMVWNASADAATVHHPRARQHVVRPSEEVVRPGQEVVPPGWYKFPGYKPIPPEENRNLDPSNFGGG